MVIWSSPDDRILRTYINYSIMTHLQLTDQQFKQQFQACTLDPALFTHEAHLRLAWIYIQQYGIEKALENIPTQIINFVDNVGARDKYNHTLTIAAIKTVYHFCLKSTADNFVDFIQEFPRLTHNFKDLIAAHYQVDIFNNELAKREFIEPDLLPYN